MFCVYFNSSTGPCQHLIANVYVHGIFFLDIDEFILAATKVGNTYVWLNDDSEAYFNTSDVLDSSQSDCVAMDVDGLHGISCEKEGPFICHTGKLIINENAPALTHLPRRVFDIPFAGLTSFGDVPLCNAITLWAKI